jgi:hypothetical protein
MDFALIRLLRTLALGAISFLQTPENHRQKPFNPLPDARVLRLPVSRDIENLDLRMIAKPLDGIRWQNASVRLDDHHGLAPEFANLKRGLGARSVGGAEPQCSVRLPNVTSGSSCVGSIRQVSVGNSVGKSSLIYRKPI